MLLILCLQKQEKAQLSRSGVVQAIHPHHILLNLTFQQLTKRGKFIM